jgi:hypothetical protein
MVAPLCRAAAIIRSPSVAAFWIAYALVLVVVANALGGGLGVAARERSLRAPDGGQVGARGRERAARDDCSLVDGRREIGGLRDAGRVHECLLGDRGPLNFIRSRIERQRDPLGLACMCLRDRRARVVTQGVCRRRGRSRLRRCRG